MIFLEEKKLGTVIKVVGVGGAGGNAVAHMIEKGLQGVDFICANTDAQVLAHSNSHTLIQLGETGLGAGANPEVGRDAARLDKEKIAAFLSGANMVFVTAGMGGGTGTGAAPVIAETAKSLGILTVGVVSKPFEFEGAKRLRVAEQGIDELSKYVDSLIVVLNEKLGEVLGDEVTQRDAFKAADNVLYNAVAGIAEIINYPGMINVDFQDVSTVMSERGRALMGSGMASGPDRARMAAEQAIACPFLEGIKLSGARGLLVNITASPDTLKLKEPKEVMNIIREYAADDATVIYGAVYDAAMNDDLRVTVVATGLADPNSIVQPLNANVGHISSSVRKTSLLNYDDLETPAVIRRRDRSQLVREVAGNTERSDVSAFLRKVTVE